MKHPAVYFAIITCGGRVPGGVARGARRALRGARGLGRPAFRAPLCRLPCVVAWAITLALLVALIAFIGDAARTQALEQWFRFAFVGVILWFLLGPAWSMVFFRRETTR